MFNSTLFHIFLLALAWGPSFVFIKIAIQELQPVTMVATRIFLAAIILTVYIKFKRVTLPKNPVLWFHAFVMGILSSSFPFILYGFSLKYTQSMIGGISNGALPIFTCILASIFLPQEKLSIKKLIGVLLGLIGFIILFLPTLGDDITILDSAAVIGCFIASFSYSMGMTYARKNLGEYRSLALPAMQLITSCVYLIPMALILENPLARPLPSLSVMGSVLLLSVVATSFAFVIYYKVIAEKGAVALSMVGYLLPLVAAMTGILILDEILTKSIIFATIFILSGMYFVNKENN